MLVAAACVVEKARYLSLLSWTGSMQIGMCWLNTTSTEARTIVSAPFASLDSREVLNVLKRVVVWAHVGVQFALRRDDHLLLPGNCLIHSHGTLNSVHVFFSGMKGDTAEVAGDDAV